MMSIPEKNKKRVTNTSVLFKNLKSMKEKIKKTARETTIEIICFVKKLPELSVGTKDFMVKSPAKRIGTIKHIKSQSILFKVRSAIISI